MLREISKTETKSDMLTEVLLYTLIILISTFLLRVLWNRSLVKHISVLKPIDSMLDAFLLSVSLMIIRGC
jgi:phosphoglycerol transferase MdoB-like AlkP superfamily enzyme